MNYNPTMIKMVLDRWTAEISRFTTLAGSLTDDVLMKEIAPGKNRGIYLLGHMVAVHDDMLLKLDFGDKLYPELFEPFIKSPDKKTDYISSAAELRAAWEAVDEKLTEGMNGLSPEAWFEKHTAVSAEDFEKEPHRNKLNIIISRTNHLSYHAGQLVLLT